MRKRTLLFGILGVLVVILMVGGYFLYPYINPYTGELGVVEDGYTIENAFQELTFQNPVDFQTNSLNESFVIEQGGKIWTITGNGSSKSLFLDVSSIIVSGGERGLLGMAFDPNFLENGYFYLDYTVPDPLRTQIVRYTVTAFDTLTVDTDNPLLILEVDQPYANHNAGQIAFGPDGMLYITMGDGGLANDPHGHGQNRETLLGSILRINVTESSTETPYTIPVDNPYIGNGQGFQEEIWAYGLRNPWRMSFDTLTGTLWAADVGQNEYEEVNIIEKAGNYGWAEKEGLHCFQQNSCDGAYIDPVFEYTHDLGISITGGYVYRGSTLSTLDGHYIFGDYASGRIWHSAYNSTSDSYDTNLLMQQEVTIPSFGLDVNGEILILSFDGNIYRIIAK